MEWQIRVVNYTSTDEDGNKIYTGHAIQTKRGDGKWTDIPVTEIYVDPPKSLATTSPTGDT